jgi:hypothetical protein
MGFWCTINTNGLSDFSEQHLVDCVFDDCGCEGGFVEDGHFTNEASYPYTGQQGTCNFEDMVVSDVYLLNYEWINSQTEDNLMNIVSEYGLVACEIDADHTSFSLYAGGIYDESVYNCELGSIPHRVGLVTRRFFLKIGGQLRN